jgi:lysophospholipase L1-like esterase
MCLGLVVILFGGLELSLWAVGQLVALGIDDRPLSDDDGSYTIAFIGDSWTVGEPDGRYPDLLVDRLNARGSASFQAINLGLHGTNSSQALHGLDEFLSREKPDLLLVMTGNNDHWNLDSSTYWKFQEGSLGSGSILYARARIFMRSLRVYKLTGMIGRKLTGEQTSNEFLIRHPEQEPRAPRTGAVDPETQRRELRFNLMQFIEIAGRHRVPVVFQTYFHFHGFHVNEAIRDVATAHRVPLVDNNRSFHDIPLHEREVLRIADGHPSALGHAFIADNIVQVLAERQLIAPAR